MEEEQAEKERLLERCREAERKIDAGRLKDEGPAVSEILSTPGNEGFKEEAERLRKEIVRLEDEIDEQEETISQYRRKQKKRDEEWSELQDELRAARHDLMQNDGTIDQLHTELAAQKDRLQAKAQALAAYRELLTGNGEGGTKPTGLHKAIDGLKDFITGDFRYFLLKHDKPLPALLEHDKWTAWERRARKGWLNGKKTVAFTGDFSAGKTSIVNRLVSGGKAGNPLLPVSTRETTAVPTYLLHDDRTACHAVTAGGAEKGISADTFRKFSKRLVDEMDGISAWISCFVFSSETLEIPENTVFLDTPGFNSAEKETDGELSRLLRECDALCWVVDVNVSLNRTSVMRMKELSGKPIYIVLNKVDTKPDCEVDEVERHLRKVLEEEHVKAEGLFRFSSKMPTGDLLLKIAEMPAGETPAAALDTLLLEAEAVSEDMGREQAGSRERLEKLERQLEELTEQMDAACKATDIHVEQAEEMPHYESRILGKGKYELAKAEYLEFFNRLEGVRRKDIPRLRQLLLSLLETKEDQAEACASYREMKRKCEEAKRMVKTLTEKVNEYRRWA